MYTHTAVDVKLHKIDKLVCHFIAPTIDDRQGFLVQLKEGKIILRISIL